jgi:hypothetical protein
MGGHAGLSNSPHVGKKYLVLLNIFMVGRVTRNKFTYIFLPNIMNIEAKNLSTKLYDQIWYEHDEFIISLFCLKLN